MENVLQIAEVTLFTLFLVIFFVVEKYLESKFHPNKKPTPILNPFFLLVILFSYWEYALEFQHFPNLKRHPVVFSFGILLLILGEFIRKIAIITLGHNFTLRISVKQRSEHKLVTTGIFKYVRHPSYAGWYIWAIGMQVMIGNPFCTIFAMIVLWRFFKIRIEFEDVYLYHFFKDEWVLYRFNTPSGILFVK